MLNLRYHSILIFLILLILFNRLSLIASPFQELDTIQLYQNIQKAKVLIQKTEYDSARNILLHTSTMSLDNNQWYLYYLAQTELAQLLDKKGDLNNVIKIYIELIRVLEKNQLYNLLADAYYSLGNEYVKYELSNKAIGYYLLSNDYYDKSEKTDKQIQTLTLLGTLYAETGSLSQAEQYLWEAINKTKKYDPELDISPLLSDLVTVYDKMGDEKKKLDVNQQLFNIAKKKSDLVAIATSLNNLGYNYAALGNYEKALIHFQNSYYTNTLINQPDTKKALGLTNIGITYHHLGRDAIAVDTLISALRLWEKDDNWQKIAEINNTIARIYLNLKEYQLSEEYTYDAIEAATKTNKPDLLKDSYEIFSQTYQERDDFENALFYYKKYLKLDDSIQNLVFTREKEIKQREFNAERAEKELSLIIADREVKDLGVRQLQLETEANQKEIALLKGSQELQALEKERALQDLKITQQALEAEKKDREIEYLQQQQELQRLVLARKEAEEKEQNQLKEQELERIILRKKLSFMTIGLLIIILILIIIGYLQKRRDNKLLSKQKESILKINEALKEKNEQIARQRDEMKHSFDELHNTVEKLKKTQNQLVEAEKMASLGQLTAGIAHEINNPINFVSSNVNPLRMNLAELKEILEIYRNATENGIENEKIFAAKELEKKYDLDYLLKEVDLLLGGISEGANRTKEIVLGLRNFSRIDEHELRSASIHESLDSTLILLQNTFKNRIDVEKDYDENLQSIECYPGQLNQVFMNIINNAIQSIVGKGKIFIKSKKIKGRAVIWIKDTGKGIQKDHLNKIFDPFFTTKEVGEGTGLGLSISYGIIQQHKGDIKVNSKPGQGTTVKISLPIKHTI